MRPRRIRIIEIATGAAVLGIFVSLAVPSLLRIRAQSRVDSLLESAKSCRAELPGWISNERSTPKKMRDEDPLLVVEPTGTLPVYCRRDGRIHLLPFVDSALESVGSTVVVTDEDRNGGPAYDGIPAVFNVEPGTK